MNLASFDQSASIHLDYGADSASFNVEDLHITTHGMRLKTRWHFAPGTELSVNFQLTDPAPSAHGSRGRLHKTEGVVVDCQRAEDCNGYQTTVLFLEVTEDILAVIDEVGLTVTLPG